MKKIFFSLFFLLACSSSLHAQTPFYQGKTITLVVGTTAGGLYDRYARLIARNIGASIFQGIQPSSCKTCRAPAR